MLPSTSDPQWKDLLTGEIHHNFKVISAGLLISRLNRQIRMDDSLNNLNEYINEAHSFFEKYRSILSDDIKAIFS